jgi:(1->4)-alpha-D-glucan 1-alpha-D-glucosylmutase
VADPTALNPEIGTDADYADWVDALHEHQITSPVAAKGIEDTAFYLYNRLLSLNEVGADPTCFGLEPAAVHAWLAERRRLWPYALSATSTHDTKRGEDVRARLNVLSEIPEEWKAAVLKWRALNRRYKTELNGSLAPDSSEEYLLYQTLVGAWPFEPDTSAFIERIGAFIPFQRRVAELGIYNGLAQIVAKMTAPGIPDFYQGSELWDLNLVDPDNRRPVDYARRRRLLKEVACPREIDDAAMAAELLARRADGRIKMFVTAKGLAAKRHLRQAFAGDYIPLQTAGEHRASMFAFARRHGDEWGDANVMLPEDAPAAFRNVFTGALLEAVRDAGAHVTTLPATKLFAELPVALLVAH